MLIILSVQLSSPIRLLALSLKQKTQKCEAYSSKAANLKRKVLIEGSNNTIVVI